MTPLAPLPACGKVLTNPSFTRRLHLETRGRRVPPLRKHPLVLPRRPCVPTLFGTFFLEPCFLRFQLHENVVCSFVQAVGEVKLGVAVCAQLFLRVLVCCGVYAGPSGTILWP